MSPDPPFPIFRIEGLIPFPEVSCSHVFSFLSGPKNRGRLRSCLLYSFQGWLILLRPQHSLTSYHKGPSCLMLSMELPHSTCPQLSAFCCPSWTLWSLGNRKICWTVCPLTIPQMLITLPRRNSYLYVRPRRPHFRCLFTDHTCPRSLSRILPFVPKKFVFLHLIVPVQHFSATNNSTFSGKSSTHSESEDFSDFLIFLPPSGHDVLRPNVPPMLPRFGLPFLRLQGRTSVNLCMVLYLTVKREVLCVCS